MVIGDAIFEDSREAVRLLTAESSRDPVAEAMRWDRIRQLQRDLAREFGRLHGWVLSKHPFSLGQLARGSNKPKDGESHRQYEYGFHLTDHAVYYRFREGPFKPAAIVAHVGHDAWPMVESQIRAACREFNVRSEHIADYPRWVNDAKLILYVPRKRKVPRCGKQLIFPFK